MRVLKSKGMQQLMCHYFLGPATIFSNSGTIVSINNEISEIICRPGVMCYTASFTILYRIRSEYHKFRIFRRHLDKPYITNRLNLIHRLTHYRFLLSR